MNRVDLVVLGLVALTALLGWFRGLTGQLLSLAGFAAGAFAGSRIAPHLLDEGTRSPLVPVASLIGAVVGAFLLQMLAGLAAGPLRGVLLRRPLRLLDAAGGFAVGAALGLGLAWLGAVVALHQPSLGLRAAVQRSAVLPALVEAIPPDRLLRALRRFDPFPRVALPELALPRPDRSVLASASARAAAAGVVKIVGDSCGLGVQGSGWVVEREIVATNAHVIAGQRRPTVLTPQGRRLGATPVYLDTGNDVALLRVRTLRAPALPLARHAPDGEAVVLLGYPENGALTATPGTAGAPRKVLAPDALGTRPRLRTIVPLRGDVRPGDSGGPVVNEKGRVVAMIFAATTERRAGVAVPVSLVARGLDGPLGPVPTGPCAP